MKFFKKALYYLSSIFYFFYSSAHTPATLPALHKALNAIQPAEHILYEDEQAYALRDAAAPSSASLLIFPKRELACIRELDFDKRSNRELLAHLLWVAQHLGNLLFSTQDYRITIHRKQDYSEQAPLCVQLDAQ